LVVNERENAKKKKKTRMSGKSRRISSTPKAKKVVFANVAGKDTSEPNRGGEKKRPPRGKKRSELVPQGKSLERSGKGHKKRKF